MLKKILFLLLFIVGLSVQSQTKSNDFKAKKIVVKKDTLQIDTVAINPNNFKIFDAKLNTIPTTDYSVDFSNAVLIINKKKYPEILVEYFKIPDFITKTYTPFNENLILPNSAINGKLYSLTTNKKDTEIQLFEGLQTKGFISRGVTSGNNQNAVTNSALDLEISGKLSDKLTLRANIFDTNVPIQQNGYSQNITDFDRIFIEMFTDTWRVKAGDIALKNTDSYFLPISKQISGLRVETQINKHLKVAAAGAIVRGKFNRYKVTATEGNQGPYKIFGENNEAAIIIIGGSDKVYINGITIRRGKDYTIDYNLAELTFTTTFPVTNDMRITVDFQYSDRNFTRFLTYEEVNYTSEKLNISGYFYSENDAKNQSLQQSLSNTQKEILANAGNDQSLLFSESAFVDTFDENKIQYKKVINGTSEFFEFSTDPNETLYFVTFTNLGTNQGDYIIESSTAIGTIFTYVGKNNGTHSPIIRLIPPTKQQTFVVKSHYNSTKKTKINSEIAVSNNDDNLFSTKDNANNVAIATKLNWEQLLIDKQWQLKSTLSHEFVQKNFNTEMGWESVEFNRDWNILTNDATKNYFQSELKLENKKEDFVLYRFNNLKYPNTFNGNKHELQSKFNLKKTTFYANTSLLNNSSTQEDNSFLIANAKVEHNFNKKWLGAFVNLETNSRKNNTTKQFINTSHRFKHYETYFGVGDSTKIFAKLGFNYRTNDSIKVNTFTEINNRKTWYAQSNLIQNNQTNLRVFANYRVTKNNFTEDETSLNSKVNFNQFLFNKILNLNTVYESSSGNIAQQEFVYIRTEPGLGFYTWIDYNNDGIQDFDEFEIAEFQDQANYLRVPKPNIQFIPTQKVKFTQSVTLNPNLWSTKKGIKKLFSRFYNQSFFNIENQQRRTNANFNFNPFGFDDDNLVGLNFNLKNTIYFNKDLQKYSVAYTTGESRSKQQFFIGSQENKLQIQQIDIAHKFANFWLLEFLGKSSTNNLETENFSSRNYNITTKEFQPKLSFLQNDTNRLTVFYHLKNKENKLESFETLKQQKLGAEYFYVSNKKNQISANINVFLNDFKGDANTPVAYQMLEGLQPGQNFTWNLLFNQKLNNFLNLNLSYLGRKSEASKAIHTGSVQLKAIF